MEDEEKDDGSRAAGGGSSVAVPLLLTIFSIFILADAALCCFCSSFLLPLELDLESVFPTLRFLLWCRRLAFHPSLWWSAWGFFSVSSNLSRYFCDSYVIHSGYILIPLSTCIGPGYFALWFLVEVCNIYFQTLFRLLYYYYNFGGYR